MHVTSGLATRSRSHPLWRWGPLLCAELIAACAEAPTPFFESWESSVGAPQGFEADSGSVALPGTLDGSSPGVRPTFPIADASAPSSPPMMDAGVSRPADAGPDTAAPRPIVDASGPTLDASRPPIDAAPDVTVRSPEASVPPPASQTCATTPAYATPDACSRCICSKCASQVATCYASNEPDKNQLCKQVRDCAQANRCTGDRCYCGEDPLCIFPMGPCVRVIQSAAGAIDVGMAAADSQNPLGRSNQVGMCTLASCPTECGL